MAHFTTLPEYVRLSSADIAITTVLITGARCSSMVECLLMVRWVVGSILCNGPIELNAWHIQNKCYVVHATAPTNWVQRISVV